MTDICLATWRETSGCSDSSQSTEPRVNLYPRSSGVTLLTSRFEAQWDRLKEQNTTNRSILWAAAVTVEEQIMIMKWLNQTHSFVCLFQWYFSAAHTPNIIRKCNVHTAMLRFNINTYMQNTLGVTIKYPPCFFLTLTGGWDVNPQFS